MAEPKVAVITGANTGIGLALAERLLQIDQSLRLCLACRNMKRATAAREALLVGRPDAHIDIVQIDVSCIKSVYKAAQELNHKYHHIDFMFMNAGSMAKVQFNWSNLFKGIFSRNAIHMFMTGDGLIEQVDQTTPEGLQYVFTTNLFGHFVLLQEIEELLGGGGRGTKVIWSSSSNAFRSSYSLDDIQHKAGRQCYSSSKYGCDLLSYHINAAMNKKGIYSSVACPGFVYTQMTQSILPGWFWNIALLILIFIRFVIPSMTITTFNGAESLVYLYKQPAESLDPLVKYHSNVGIFGNPYVTPLKMDLDVDLAESTYIKLCEMESQLIFRENITQES